MIRKRWLDEGVVYWLDFATEGNAGMIRSVPKAGGAVNTLVVGQERLDGELAIDDHYVYFVDGALLRVPKSGGEPSLLAPNLYNVGGIAVDEVGVYWSGYGVSKLFQER